jgi:hypothetical protein
MLHSVTVALNERLTAESSASSLLVSFLKPCGQISGCLPGTALHFGTALHQIRREDGNKLTIRIEQNKMVTVQRFDGGDQRLTIHPRRRELLLNDLSVEKSGYNSCTAEVG